MPRVTSNDNQSEMAVVNPNVVKLYPLHTSTQVNTLEHSLSQINGTRYVQYVPYVHELIPNLRFITSNMHQIYRKNVF